MAKPKQKFNNKSEKVSVKDITLFDGDIWEFKEKMGVTKSVYLRKDKGRKIVHLWWEDKEKWFINQADQNGVKLDDSTWTTDGNWEKTINYYLNQEYRMYIKK